MTNNIPYMRNKTATLLTISAAAIALLLISSPLVLSHLLLQPVQATLASTIPTSVQTSSPVDLETSCSSAPHAALTFAAEDPAGDALLTNGSFQITNSSSGQILWNGHLDSGAFSPYNPNGQTWDVYIKYKVDGNSAVCGGSGDLIIQTNCTFGEGPFNIAVSTDGGNLGNFLGNTDCKFGSDTTAQPSSSSPPPMTGTTTTTTAQDSDGDGIPDSSDKCTHNSNPRCFKEEGDTSSSTTTTTHEQQPSSLSSGNQTR